MTTEMRTLATSEGRLSRPPPLGVYTVEVSAAANARSHGPILNAVRAHQKMRLAEPVSAR
jgi:hypothetical protein